MKTILILEDNDERIADFQKAISAFGDDFELKVWPDTAVMTAECEKYFPSAVLISLDYSPNPKPWETGLDAAKYLAEYRPVCPVVIHSDNFDRARAMESELLFSGWTAECVAPVGSDWVKRVWIPKVQNLIAEHANTWSAKLPVDHEVRLHRTLLSLDGLSVGDGFGECFFTSPAVIERRLEHRHPPPSPWFVTDDTMMAVSIVRTLKRYGFIEQDALAGSFAREYVRDPKRGYGGTAHGILRSIAEGTHWKTAAGRVFDGQGSCGNGGAMRAAPIGAYFADDIERVITEASASAAVTHAHVDGQTGAIAAALAAAWMVQEPHTGAKPNHAVIEFVLEHLPQTDTYYRLKKALEVPLEISPRSAALFLGNGSGVISSDTIPFYLWCAARHHDSYTDALWATVSGLGDRDTTCAIVGGIVALSAGRESITSEWLAAREPIHL